jgi:hypothetical protein
VIQKVKDLTNLAVLFKTNQYLIINYKTFEMKLSREQQLTIALLKEKLETLTGKKVAFAPTAKQTKVKQMVEALEKLSGRKVMFEAPMAGVMSSAPAQATGVAQAQPATGAPAVVDPGKAAAAKAIQAMSLDPILAPAVKQIAANPQVKQLAQEATMNEEVVSLTVILLGMAALGALAGLAQLIQNAAENRALKAQILAAIQKDFAKAGVQATPEQIEAEIVKRTGVAKAKEAAKTYQGTAARRGY